MDERIRELAHRLVNYSCRVSRGIGCGFTISEVRPGNWRRL